MKIILSFLLIIILSNTVAQPTIDWEKSFGGSNGESANSIQQTSDGGYIVAGYSCSNDGDVLQVYRVYDLLFVCILLW